MVAIWISVIGYATITAVPGAYETSASPFHWHLPLLSLPSPSESLNCGRWRSQIFAPASNCERPGNIGSVTPRVSESAPAWAGNPSYQHDARRSIESAKLLPSCTVPGITFYNVQIYSDKAQGAALTAAGMIDLTSHIADFADTAALMSELDLIITVDNSGSGIPGLGALGKPSVSTAASGPWALQIGAGA